MGAKVTDKVTADGRKFQQMIKELAELEVRVGFRAGETKGKDGTDICDRAVYNELGTDNIPSRPFIRDSVDDNEEEIREFLKGMKREIIRGKSAESVLKNIGIFHKKLIQDKIETGNYTPNAPATLRKKRPRTKPLIDTADMIGSVNFVIKKKGSGD